MGLAKANATVEEERIVCLGRFVGNGLAGRMGKPIARADHKAVKGVARLRE